MEGLEPSPERSNSALPYQLGDVAATASGQARTDHACWCRRQLYRLVRVARASSAGAGRPPPFGGSGVPGGESVSAVKVGLAGTQGLEPWRAVLETAMSPLHHIPWLRR